MKTIIDISKHNGAVDWERVKKSDVSVTDVNDVELIATNSNTIEN